MSESFIDLKCNKSCRHIRELEQQLEKSRLQNVGDNYYISIMSQKVEELEQQLSELKESQKQKQITRLCNRLDKAEQQNEQMLKTLIFAYRGDIDDPSQLKWVIESVTGKSIDELLK